MTAKKHEMTAYQQINHAARDRKPAAEILKLCREVLENTVLFDVEFGAWNTSLSDMSLALWAVAVRLNEAERNIETLKRKARRKRQTVNEKKQSELLKKESGQTTQVT